MRIGLGLAGVIVNEKTAEVIVKVYEGIQKKQGKFSIRDAVDIEFNVNKSLTKKTVKAVPNP